MIAAIEERSGGKITFDYHNGGTLGNYVEMTGVHGNGRP